MAFLAKNCHAYSLANGAGLSIASDPPGFIPVIVFVWYAHQLRVLSETLSTPWNQPLSLAPISPPQEAFALTCLPLSDALRFEDSHLSVSPISGNHILVMHFLNLRGECII